MSGRLAFVFPGQGSQSLGMGRSWAERYPLARDAYAQAEAVAGFPLSRLCWEGPEAELQMTANTQPAILATSVAIWRVLEESGLVPEVVAGHSLGEYSALVAAGSLDFGDALRLVRRRGQLMQEAVAVGEGAMAAVLGLDAAAVAAVAEQAAGDQVCAVANLNAPDQVVIAGHREAIERAATLAKQQGARRVLPLPVSAPFHSPLMAPARAALTPHLGEARFADPRWPVVCNVDAAPLRSGEEVRQALIRQIDQPVRWVESVRHMTESMGVERLVEIGPGRVLTGLGRRIAPQVESISLSEPEDLYRFLGQQGGPR